MSPLFAFRFSTNPYAAADAGAWRDLARRVEGLGYSSLLMPDHLNPQFAPVPALAAAAAATTTLRVGFQVLNNDLRHPVVAAKEIATLDVLSEGRVEWGMGAGWLPVDYEATGTTFDAPGVRVERLAEAIALMRAHFAGEPLDHAGRHYTARGPAGSPRPVQRPHPPLLVGASHERMLRLAGREAETVSISPSWDSRTIMGRPPLMGVEQAMGTQVGWVQAAATTREAPVELSVTVSFAAVSDRPDEALERAATGLGLTVDEARRSPHALAGSVDEVCDRLWERRERYGISHVVLPPGAFVAFAPVVARLAGR